MDFRRGVRTGAGLFVGIAALLGAACPWASPVVVKSLSVNSGSPAAVQTLVSYLLGGGITVVPESIQYTGAAAASRSPPPASIAAARSAAPRTA